MPWSSPPPQISRRALHLYYTTIALLPRRTPKSERIKSSGFSSWGSTRSFIHPARALHKRKFSPARADIDTEKTQSLHATHFLDEIKQTKTLFAAVDPLQFQN
jgi:hypothetical protein